MKQPITPIKLLWLAWAGLAALAAILYAVSVPLYLEPSDHYFEAGALLPTLAAVLALLSLAAGTVAVWRTHPEELNDSPFPEKPLPAPAAIGFFASAVVFLLGVKLSLNRILILLVILFSLLAAFYSLLLAFRRNEKSAGLLPILGATAVLACLFLCAYYYFDASMEMNAPLKIALQMGLLCAMIYYSSEIRFLLGKPLPRIFMMLAVWTVSMSSLSILAVPIAFFTGRVDRPDYLSGALMTLFVAATAALRIYTMTRRPEDPEFPEEDPYEVIDPENGEDQE